MTVKFFIREFIAPSAEFMELSNGTAKAEEVIHNKTFYSVAEAFDYVKRHDIGDYVIDYRK